MFKELLCGIISLDLFQTCLMRRLLRSFVEICFPSDFCIFNNELVLDKVAFFIEHIKKTMAGRYGYICFYFRLLVEI